MAKSKQFTEHEPPSDPTLRRSDWLSDERIVVYVKGEPDPDRVNWARLILLGYSTVEADRIIGLMRAQREQDEADKATNEAGAESS